MSKRGKSMNAKTTTPISKFMRWSRVARFYHNGDGAGFVWNWWHPLSWPLFPLAFLVSVVLSGVSETWSQRHDLGLGMNPWFKENPDKLEWE